MRVEPRSDTSSLGVSQETEFFYTIVCRKAASGKHFVSENTGKSKLPLQSLNVCRQSIYRRHAE